MSEELRHYGVKGMKWGVRNNRNPNYTEKQRQRDRQFYGKGGERRINSKLNKGYGIQSARNYESDRLNRARNKAQSSASIGRMVGGVGGAILGAASPKVVYAGTHASMNLRGYSAKKARNSTSVSETKDTRDAADTMARMIINR